MKITIEFETNDLPAFDENSSEPGAGKENVASFLRDKIFVGVLEQKMRFMCSHKRETDQILYDATLDAYDQQERLARRIMENIKIS